MWLEGLHTHNPWLCPCCLLPTSRQLTNSRDGVASTDTPSTLYKNGTCHPLRRSAGGRVRCRCTRHVCCKQRKNQHTLTHTFCTTSTPVPHQCRRTYGTPGRQAGSWHNCCACGMLVQHKLALLSQAAQRARATSRLVAPVIKTTASCRPPCQTAGPPALQGACAGSPAHRRRRQRGSIRDVAALDACCVHAANMVSGPHPAAALLQHGEGHDPQPARAVGTAAACCVLVWAAGFALSGCPRVCPRETAHRKG